MTDPKETLKRYLQSHRDAMLWKLDGPGEREIRWPMTPTGTNLLGLVKHLACVETGYFGATFGRPSPERIPYDDPDAGENDDLFATADESREDIVAFYKRTWAHSDETIDGLDLDAPGKVAWWRPEKQDVTLHQILVHMIAETARHAGHADIVRELTDGGTGLRPDNSNLPDQDRQWWDDYVAMLKSIAERA